MINSQNTEIAKCRNLSDCPRLQVNDCKQTFLVKKQKRNNGNQMKNLMGLYF